MPTLAELLAGGSAAARPKDTWVEKLAQSLVGAAALPGDVYSGRTPIMEGGHTNPEVVNRSADLAGTMMLGSTAAPAGVLGSGFVRPQPGQGIRAYHGSPHDFERFDISKIGTGEGAQAYGHGLYFAENEGVARTYRDLGEATINGVRFDPQNPLHRAAGLLDQLGSKQAAINEAKGLIARDPSDSYYRDVLRWLEKDTSLPEVKSSGRMYEVNIAAKPEQFLDWDRPLSAQAPDVMQKMIDVGALKTPEYAWQPTRSGMTHLIRSDAGSQSWGNVTPADFGGYWAHDMHGHVIAHAPTETLARAKVIERAPKMPPPDPSKVSGQHAYYGASNAQGDIFSATNALRDAGIPGIRYLDQGSRAAGEGSRNYVVFDDKLIDILRKYGLAGLLASGATMSELMDQAKQPTAP